MKSEATTLLAAEAKSGSRVGTASLLLLHGPTARGTVLADIVVWSRSLNEPLIFKDRMASAAGRSIDAQSACACPLAAGPVGSATGSAGEDAGSRRNVPSIPARSRDEGFTLHSANCSTSGRRGSAGRADHWLDEHEDRIGCRMGLPRGSAAGCAARNVPSHAASPPAGHEDSCGEYCGYRLALRLHYWEEPAGARQLR
jgi:hypothetical protein